MKKLLLFLLAAPVWGGELILAERGQPAAYVIVLPQAPSESQRYAAEELVAHVERMTGVKLPIKTAADPRPARGIFLGGDCANLGEDGFRLKADPPHLLVQGSAVRGTLYGVYELLERYGGCRWYASWHTVVPMLDRFAVPDDLDDAQKPAFPHREPFWYDMFNGDFAARNKANGPSMRLGPKHGGPAARFGGGLGNCHTLQRLLPYSDYGGTHPEYFALHGGKRVSLAPGENNADYRLQPCLTNPDVLRIVTSNVLAAIRRDPSATYYGVSQNDNSNYCECPACAAVDAEEQSHAGTMVRFVNAVAEAVERDYPDKIIEFLAYRYTRRPPAKTKLRRNVMPCLCSIECDFSRPLAASRFPDNVSFVRDMRGWAAQATHLYVWDYVTDFHNYPTPHPNVYALQDNVRFMRDNRVSAYFTQGDRQGSHAGFAELKAWLLAKWMWNPELPIKPLLDDFFAGFYGRGAPYVREAFEKLHQLELAYTEASSDRALFCEPCGMNRGIPDAFWGEAVALVDRAFEAVKGDSAYEYNVRTAQFSFDYARLETLRAESAVAVDFTGRKSGVESPRELTRLARRAVAFFDHEKTIRICSSVSRQGQILGAWRKLAEGSCAARTDGVLEDGFIGYNSERPVTRVADATAGDGHAIRFADPVPRWSSMTALSCAAFVPGAKYRLAVRARADVKPGRAGAALTAGIHDPDARRSVACLSANAAQLKGGYVWISSPPFTPSELGANAYVFIGDGYGAPDRKPVVAALFVDCVRFIPESADAESASRH